MTRRERLEKKLEKRKDWAESRDAKADAAHTKARQIMDTIPFGQPILVGHHSEGRHRRDLGRIESGIRSSVENSRAADDHRSKAAGLESALATSVYSDDPDAVERLEEIVGELVAERDRWKAYNASCKRGAADIELLDEKQKETVATIHRVAPYQLGKNGEIGYTNLSATIRQKTKRIAQIKRERELAEAGVRAGGRVMESRYAGECPECGEPIEKGDSIVWYRSTREALHRECSSPLDGALVVSYGRLSNAELEAAVTDGARQEKRAAIRELAHREKRRELFSEEEGGDG